MKLPIKIQLPRDFLEEENRNNYTVTKEMKKLWAVELDLLVQLDSICKKYGIRYYVSMGTLLGVVRHSGFIPWDDDIDVMMDRINYDLLCKHNDDFKYPYFLQTEYTDKGSLRGHAQLRNSETTGILDSEEKGRFLFNQGVFIDIFPLDNVPDNPKKRTHFISSLEKIKIIIQYFQYLPVHRYESIGIKRLIKDVSFPIIKWINNKFNILHIIYCIYEKKMKRYNNLKTKNTCLLSLASISMRCIWDKDYFAGEEIYLPFEFLKVPVPSGYVEILNTSYGNWRMFRKDNTNHGGIIFDCNKSYREFLEI